MNGMTYLESCAVLGYQCILEGMIAQNKINEINGIAPVYGGDEFQELKEKIMENMRGYADDMKKRG